MTASSPTSLTLTTIVPATNRPATLPRCLAAIRAADEPPEELIVARRPERAGPAAARNAGARAARGDVFVFVDADVVVHRDAFSRIRAAFAAREDLTALFGSYDDLPEARDPVSSFRNLLHHYVHQSCPGPTSTFWAGLGAIRREAFTASGGFDAVRFPRPSIEDIELGMRLVAAGARVELDPMLQGTHLKRWTLREMVLTDFSRRAVPWTSLLVRTRSTSTALNLGWHHRLSAAASVASVGALASRNPRLAAVFLLTFALPNAAFYRLLARQRGNRQALLGIALHMVHHLTAVAAVPVGIGTALLDGVLREGGAAASAGDGLREVLDIEELLHRAVLEVDGLRVDSPYVV